MAKSSVREFDCLVKDCRKIFNDYFEYSRHLCSYHGLPINIMYLKFDDEAAFNSWISHEEYVNNCMFIRKDDEAVYKCHRSDFILNSVKNDDLLCRQEEDERLFKARSPCPAHLKFEIKDEAYHVMYVRTHFGHCKDLSTIALSNETQKMVLDLIRKKMSDRSVVDKVRDSIKDKSHTDYLITTKHVEDLKNEKAI